MSRNTFAASRRSHRILKWLQNGERVGIRDVMEEFGIQYPQARADLKLLEELYNLETEREGRTKVWKWSGLDADYVDVATAAALELGAVSLDIFRDTPYGEAIDRVSRYCRERVPQAHRPRIDRLSRALHLRRNWNPVEAQQLLEHLEVVLNEMYVATPHWLVGRYQRADGGIGEYLLCPRYVVWYQGRLWLLAIHWTELKLFDVAGFEALERYRPSERGADLLRRELEERGAERHPAELEGEEFESFLAERDVDPESYFEHSFGIFAGAEDVERIRLLVRGPWASYLERYRIHPTQEMRSEGDALEVQLELAIDPEFESFVLGMIPDVEVRAPTRLREDLEERVRNWLGG